MLALSPKTEFAMPVPNPLPSVVQATAESLQDELTAYWPSSGENNVPEANAVLHLAFALRSEGFRVYPQVQLNGHRRKHIDLFAFHPESGMGVAVEGKKLYPGKKAEVKADWKRLLEYRLPREHTRRPLLTSSLAMVIGTTFHRQSVIRWWEGRKFSQADVLEHSLGNVGDWGVHTLFAVVQPAVLSFGRR
jgi:hypothetical protein